jgi:hypothetical protein
MSEEMTNPEAGVNQQQDGSLESAQSALLAMDSEPDEYKKPRATMPGEAVEETPDEPEQKEEENSEQVETEAEEGPETEVEEEQPSYTVKVNGQERSVTLEDLQSGYLKGQDYTQKTQELAEQRRTVEEAQKTIQQERQLYVTALEQASADKSKQLEEYNKLDWDALREEDPMLFMQRRDERRDLETSIKEDQLKQQQTVQQMQQHHAEQFQRDVELGKSQLLEKMPDWDAKVSKAVREYGQSLGFTDQELSNLTDHRSMMVLRDAMRYRNIQKTKPGEKKVKNVPKYVKSGTSRGKAEASGDKRAEKMKQLRKTGSLSDAGSVLYDLL